MEVSTAVPTAVPLAAAAAACQPSPAVSAEATAAFALPAAVCRRHGCPYSHKKGPRRHGYCCSECRRCGKVHTSNCSGAGAEPAAAAASPAVPAVAAAWQASPAAPAATQRCQPPAVPTAATRGIMVSLPASWRRDVLDTPIAFVERRAARYGLALDAAAEEAWRRVGVPVLDCRRLRLFPYAQDSIPPHLRGACVDVALRGMTGHSNMYKMSCVTGVDFCVQAVVATQPATADALREAILRIQGFDFTEFSFVCRSATHRSVACCFLLAAIAFPHAEICLTTERTRRAAESAGLTLY